MAICSHLFPFLVVEHLYIDPFCQQQHNTIVPLQFWQQVVEQLIKF
jgi:hypothetical protein